MDSKTTEALSASDIEHLVAILKSYRNDEAEKPLDNEILTQSEIDQLLGAMCETEMNTPELTKGEIADMSAKFKAEYGKPDGKDMREEHLFRQFVADETGWPYRGLNDDIAIAAIECDDDFNFDFDFDFDDGSEHMSGDEAEALAVAEEIRKEIEKRGKCGTEKPSAEHCECAVASLSITADKSGQGSGITVKIRRPKRDENTIVANTPTNHTFSVLIPEEAESGEIAENAEKIALRLKAISEKAAKEASKEAKIASVRDASVRALLETAGMSDCVEVETWVGTPESCVTIKRGFGIKAAARIAPDDTSADIIAKVKDARARGLVLRKNQKAFGQHVVPRRGTVVQVSVPDHLNRKRRNRNRHDAENGKRRRPRPARNLENDDRDNRGRGGRLPRARGKDTHEDGGYAEQVRKDEYDFPLPRGKDRA